MAVFIFTVASPWATAASTVPSAPEIDSFTLPTAAFALVAA